MSLHSADQRFREILFRNPGFPETARACYANANMRPWMRSERTETRLVTAPSSCGTVLVRLVAFG
jgi:hypothetical protein